MVVYMVVKSYPHIRSVNIGEKIFIMAVLKREEKRPGNEAT